MKVFVLTLLIGVAISCGGGEPSRTNDSATGSRTPSPTALHATFIPSTMTPAKDSPIVVESPTPITIVLPTPQVIYVTTAPRAVTPSPDVDTPSPTETRDLFGAFDACLAKWSTGGTVDLSIKYATLGGTDTSYLFQQREQIKSDVLSTCSGIGATLATVPEASAHCFYMEGVGGQLASGLSYSKIIGQDTYFIDLAKGEVDAFLTIAC